jgi:hypothetical protein
MCVRSCHLSVCCAWSLHVRMCSNVIAVIDMQWCACVLSFMSVSRLVLWPKTHLTICRPPPKWGGLQSYQTAAVQAMCTTHLRARAACNLRQTVGRRRCETRGGGVRRQSECPGRQGLPASRVRSTCRAPAAQDACAGACPLPWRGRHWSCCVEVSPLSFHLCKQLLRLRWHTPFSELLISVQLARCARVLLINTRVDVHSARVGWHWCCLVDRCPVPALCATSVLHRTTVLVTCCVHVVHVGGLGTHQFEVL